MTREARHYLFDTLANIRLCSEIIDGRPLDGLQSDVPARMALERAIEIISEASRHIPEVDKATEPQTPWRKIADVGNRLRHAYHLSAIELIYAIGTEGVAELRPAVERLYERHKRPQDPWPDADQV